MKDMCVTQLALHLDATTPSTEPYSSKTVVTTLESIICLFLCKDSERRTEYRTVQFRHFLIELNGTKLTSFLSA